MSYSMQPKRGLYVLKSGAPRTAPRPTICSARWQQHGMHGSQQVFWLNTYIRPNTNSDLQYCVKYPPNSTVALILACSVRQELVDHLGTRSAQCRTHITWYSKTDRCYTQPWLAENWQWHQQYENQTFVSWSPVFRAQNWAKSLGANWLLDIFF